LLGKGMTGPDIASAAFKRAWRVYLLLHVGVDESDQRSVALDYFIREQCEAGVTDVEVLVVEGLKYLRRLDRPEAGLPE